MLAVNVTKYSDGRKLDDRSKSIILCLCVAISQNPYKSSQILKILSQNPQNPRPNLVDRIVQGLLCDITDVSRSRYAVANAQTECNAHKIENLIEQMGGDGWLVLRCQSCAHVSNKCPRLKSSCYHSSAEGEHCTTGQQLIARLDSTVL